MLITCLSCHISFSPDPQQSELLASMEERGQKLVMLKCPSCQHTFPLNPVTLLAPTKSQYAPLACPVCSDGIVSFVDDSKKPFWGCGACGNIWHHRNEIAAP